MATGTKQQQTPAPAAKPPTTALVTQSQGALVLGDSGVPAEEDLGFEEFDASNVAIPFLVVLQKGSPQCDPEDPRYVEGAKPGMFANSVSDELYDGKDGGVQFVPCAYKKRYLRWGARESGGGGFKGEHTQLEVEKLRDQGVIAEQDGRLYVPDENGNVNPKRSDRFAETHIYFSLLLLADGRAKHVVISLSSTQVKKAKLLNNFLQEQRPKSMFQNLIRATTVGESNEKGSWSGWKFTRLGDNAVPELVAAGREFQLMVAGSRAVVNFDSLGDDGGDATTNSAPPPTSGAAAAPTRRPPF